jgi:hypothetical protein
MAGTMTEQEWRNSTDPLPMLEYLQGKATDRKLRLFVVACCRSLFPLIQDKYCRKAVRTAERFADGEVSPEKLRFAWASARRSARTNRRLHRNDPETSSDIALWAVAAAVEERIANPIWLGGALTSSKKQGLIDSTMIDEARILRDIFHYPYGIISFSASSLSHDTVILAQKIYDERAFDRLPILADALEQAGCDNQEVLNHCRGSGPHVRGCWVVDVALGKV